MTAPITGQSHQAVDATPEWLAEEVAETYGNLAAGASQPGTLWERAAEGQQPRDRPTSPLGRELGADRARYPVRRPATLGELGGHSGTIWQGPRPWWHEECVRVSGNVACSVCGRPYWRHPGVTDEVPTFRRACDGRLLKL